MANKSDVFVKLILMFFISLLSFSVGTYVGKKYSDHQYKLSELEPSHNEKSHGAAHEAVATIESDNEYERSPASAMSDKEIADLAEEFVEDEKATNIHEEHTTEKKQASSLDHGKMEQAKADHNETAAAHAQVKHKESAPTAVAHKEEAPSPVAQAIAHNQKPMPAKKEIAQKERLPSSLPTSPVGSMLGKFTVQIFSTQDEKEAFTKANGLKKKGYSSFYVPTNVHGKTWYRVNIGQFNSPKEAVDYKEQLIKSSLVDAAIIQKISN